MSNSRIPVLWFDANGGGPDHLALELHPFPDEMHGRIPARLGLRVRDGRPVIGVAEGILVDGGFMLDRSGVEQLRQQLGAWLEETKERT